MQFQILCNNEPLTMGALDKSAADFWGVETSDFNATPKGRHWTDGWFQFIGGTIAQMPKGNHGWFEIIGKLCGIAAIGEKSFPDILRSIEYYKPYIELCLYWDAQGYIPVSC